MKEFIEFMEFMLLEGEGGGCKVYNVHQSLEEGCPDSGPDSDSARRLCLRALKTKRFFFRTRTTAPLGATTFNKSHDQRSLISSLRKTPKLTLIFLQILHVLIISRHLQVEEQTLYYFVEFCPTLREFNRSIK